MKNLQSVKKPKSLHFTLLLSHGQGVHLTVTSDIRATATSLHFLKDNLRPLQSNANITNEGANRTSRKKYLALHVALLKPLNATLQT